MENADIFGEMDGDIWEEGEVSASLCSWLSRPTDCEEFCILQHPKGSEGNYEAVPYDHRKKHYTCKQTVRLYFVSPQELQY